MNSVVDDKPRRRVYPYLGEYHDGTIILFDSPRSGVIVRGDRIGCYSDEWSEESYEYFTGTVTLSN